jgi:hypothetical protein
VIDTFAAMISGSPVCWTSPSIGTNPAHDTRLSSSKRAKSVENLCDTRTGSAFLEPGRSVPRNTYHSSSEGTLLIHTPLNQHRTSTDPGPKKLRRLAGLRTQVEQAMGRQALAHLRTLNTAVTNIAHLEDALGEAFAQHPDAAIITSFPALGTVLGARILGEIGDDRTRFANAKVLKARCQLFLGVAPARPLTRSPRPLRPPPRARRHLQRRCPPPR